MSTKKYTKPSATEIKGKLTPEQFEVTQACGTEPPFHNAYWDNHKAGIYVDVVTGEPLFSSTDKFDSGTGWPSFTQPVERAGWSEKTDSTLRHDADRGPLARRRFAPRPRVRRRARRPRTSATASTRRRCASSRPRSWRPRATARTARCSRKARVGRAPKQGPRPSPADDARRQSSRAAASGAWRSCCARSRAWSRPTSATPAARRANPTYSDVHDGTTGHAEAVRVVFDPSKLTYEDLLEKWFFRMHDPTTKNRQGNDVGSQYRSAIFVTSPAQRKIAEEAKDAAGSRGAGRTRSSPRSSTPGTWTPAESYHQDYLQKNPGGYTCHYMRD